MDTIKSFEAELYAVNAVTFDEIALRLFRFQAQYNAIYKSYLENLGISIDSVDAITKIPFLPISFFKNHMLKTGNWNAVTEFTSSGTTGETTSRHLIHNPDVYLELSAKTFEDFFGPLTQYHFLALLPAYLDRSNSSLVLMIENFVKKSASTHSSFYNKNYGQLMQDFQSIKDERKIVIWGVTFGLMELAEKYQPDFNNCIVFETGGMKGRRKEITRQELHQVLTQNLNVESIYSEYGMTELLSQAYTKGKERFYCSSRMKVLARELTDPFNVGIDEVGGLNVVDLANVHSISFIETEDIGRVYTDGSFEVLGRMDNSDVRGCNLLMH